MTIECKRQKFLDKLAYAQKALNDLLMEAYQYDVKCVVRVNEARAVDDDDRQVIGIEVFEAKPLYGNDGTP